MNKNPRCKIDMERQYAHANPSAGQCPERIPDALLFERWGDDSLLYFQDPVNAMLVGTRGSPLGLDQPGKNRCHHPEPKHVTSTVTSQLASQPGKVKQSFILEGHASVHMFLDAWLPYQTTPIYVTATLQGCEPGACTANQPPVAQGNYAWTFFNYVPIGGCAPIHGSGVAETCPNLNESAPIIRTLGHMARSPTGEFPISQATKNKACYAEHERPKLIFQNNSAPGTAPILVTIGIGE